MKIVYIMRGVPGSGKSTFARILANEAGVIHSTDDYFYKNGEYVFDPSLLSEYHDQNFAAFCKSLQKGISIVICDNTNTRCWHFERYTEVAARAGYLVALVVMPHPDPEIAAIRTVHSVPSHVISQMISEWEH